MRKFILPVLLCIIFINPATANDEINSLLKTLDKALKYKLDYAEQKQEQIDSLKIELKLHHKIRKKVQIAELLCFAYSSFQKDSALTYAIHMNELAQESGDGELIIEAKLDYARILSSMGFFKEALSIVNPIQHQLLSPKLKVEYFLGQATIYNHQKNFASSEIESRKNDLIEQTYRDSLLQCAEVPSNIRAFTIAPILLHKKKYNDAIHMLDSAYLSYPQYSRNAGILAYSLASAYQGKGDSKNAIKYFAISAISDAISETRENRSLRILAKLIFESGDIDRAYAYMKNADVLVQTSRFEGKSVVLDEGKILCCPIVTTNYPTVYDQINKDEGVIVGMNGKEIADGILKILKDPHQYSEYLSQHEYGNEKEIEGYYQLFNLQ